MTLKSKEISIAQEIFKGLAGIEFNHRNREDCQQIYLEPLEIVATAVGLKKSFCAGLSAYYEPFCKRLSKFASTSGILWVETPSIELRTQLMALTDQKISHDVLAHLSNSLVTKGEKNISVLWLFTDPATKEDILAAAQGRLSLGETLGYPRCCTDAYLFLESQIIETEIDFYTKYCGAKNDQDIISHYKSSRLIQGSHVDKLDEIKNEIQTLQALSIKKFPFIHYIACRNCIDKPDSQAAKQNKMMSDLAHTLNPTFARKFSTYADNYYRTFQSMKDNLPTQDL